MAKALQAAEKVPVGFINASWGGTPAEAWLPEPRLRRMKGYDPALDLLDKQLKDSTGAHQPSAAAFPVGAAGLAAAPWEAMSGLSVLYNGMISPLAPYRLKGVAWYQGESNWRTPAQYESLLTALIADWRETFAEPDLPFLVVQLPAYGAPASAPAKPAWPELREAERRTVLATPGTALAVTIDVGDRFDIHPAEKAVVGQRLALAARRAAYGETASASPAPIGVERRGGDLVVTFSDTGKGLVTYSSPQAIGFEACDAQRTCRFVQAVPDGDKVVLKDANAPNVRFVRYAWADAPFVNLFNSADLPATPFELTVP
jgi:sialate O-acetylesterase